jgi:hypothetical protein
MFICLIAISNHQKNAQDGIKKALGDLSHENNFDIIDSIVTFNDIIGKNTKQSIFVKLL